MTTPSSGQISFSQIAQITKASSTATISLGESDTRYLLDVSSGQISISSAYNKPAAGGTTYTTPGTYTFLVPAYQYLSTDIGGGGSGGQGAYGCGCCQFYYGLCVSCCACHGGVAGGAGANSSFNGAIAIGGSWGTLGGTVSSGYVVSANTGGGGAGGGGGGGFGWCTSGGASGYAGGRIQTGWIKGDNGPAYGASLEVVVGAGNAGGADAGGGAGASGWVYISWS